MRWRRGIIGEHELPEGRLTDLLRALVPRSEWLLDPDISFLNHGSYGAVPRIVLNEQRRLQERMECDPTEFLALELPNALRTGADRLATFIKGAGSDLVFIENATAGCNVVLGSVRLSPGDEILLTDHGYPAIRKAAEHHASRTGAIVIEAKVPFPASDPIEIINAVATRLGPRSRLVILDHVTSPTAIIFPVRELTALCHEAGAKVLIDGAHAPGMLSLDITAIDADWYVGNCHKWLMAPKGSAFLWASPASQAETHPLVTSHGCGQGFESEFDWVGTRDPTAWLTIPAAIDYHFRIGGKVLRERNTRLAGQAANLLAKHWNTERGSEDALTGSMSTVRLPLAGEATEERALELRNTLRKDHRIDAAVIAFKGSLWVRLSAQAYNHFNEYERLADAFRG
jgi:isopenicillin-N epimerase